MIHYVLTYIKNGILDACAIFDNEKAAFDSAYFTCELNNLSVNYNPTYDNLMNGWVFSDSYGCFVSVVQRPNNSDFIRLKNSNFNINNNIFNLSPFDDKSYYGNIISLKPINLFNIKEESLINKPPEKNETTVPNILSTEDDPENIDLPGGFEYAPPHKAVFMRDIFDNGGDYVRQDYEMSNNEKLSLVLARAKHRPNQVIFLMGLVFNQKDIIKELTTNGKHCQLIIDQEISEIQKIYEKHKIQRSEYFDDFEQSDYIESDD